MRATEVHFYAIIVLTLCHLDEALHDLVSSVTFRMKPAKENLCARHLSLDLADTDAVVFHRPSRRPLDLIHEETTRTYCSPTIEVSAEPSRCKDGSAAMFALVSVSENTGACPSCGNPICGPKVMAPPFPPHPSPFTVSKINTHMHIPTCAHASNREQAVQMYLTVAAFVPWNIFNDAHSTPVPSQQEATGNRWGLVRLIRKTTACLYLQCTVHALPTSGLINNKST